MQTIVTHKKMKNMRMRIDPSTGDLRVSVPLRTSSLKVQEFIALNGDWIKAQQLKLKQRPTEALVNRTEFEAETHKLFSYWTQRMNADYPAICPNRVRFRQMKTRWGVCNTQTRTITINTELMKYPPELLEYVIVHELAHLQVRAHSKEFWTVVGKYLPNWKVLKGSLR